MSKKLFSIFNLKIFFPVLFIVNLTLTASLFVKNSIDNKKFLEEPFRLGTFAIS